MQMSDEDGADLGEAQPRMAQLYLRSLATVDEEQLTPHLNDLRRGEMLQRGQGTATAEDMYSERFQDVITMMIL